MAAVHNQLKASVQVVCPCWYTLEEMMKKFLLEKDPSLQSILTCYPF